MRIFMTIGAVVAMSMMIGCAANKPAPTTRPIESADAGYWLAQPGTQRIVASDFDRLWKACDESVRRFGFRPDRQDYRAGLLTTEPLTSKQFFEFWRNDVSTIGDTANSSLATYRRTVRFEVKRGEGGFVAVPRVIIERYVRAEQPITASFYLRYAFRSQARQYSLGTPETDRGIYLPSSYWYATGRDEVLEGKIARTATKRLRRA